MSQRKIEVMECDRCGRVDEIRTQSASYAWGQINFSEQNGPRHSNGPHSREFSDICPDCMASLYAWWKSK